MVTAHVMLDQALADTNRSLDYAPIFGFPALDLTAGCTPELGFLYWHGLWPIPHAGTGLNSTLAHVSEPRRHDGAIVFTQPFDRNGGTLPASAAYSSLVVGPLSHLATTVFEVDAEQRLEFGPPSQISSLDANWTFSTLLVAGAGTTAAVHAYGAALKAWHGMVGGANAARLSDPALTHVGFWTDNGAGDFWNEDGIKVLPLPETEIPRAVQILHEQGLTIPFVQLDGLRRVGVSKWLLYKAFFAPDYDLFARYPKMQSPAGPWYPQPSAALDFFRDFFAQGVALDMASFETDFMSDHLLPTPLLFTSGDSLETYLAGLGQAALDAGIPMQWCMPTAGVVLAAVNKPAVTNVRVSVDYACEGPLNLPVSWAPNYMIGVGGLLAEAVGVVPSKDIFRTRSHVEHDLPECGSVHDQPNFELDALLAVWSTGPVGVGDGTNLTNITLAQRLGRSDGVVLRPDRPATAVDATFVPPAQSQKTLQPLVGFLPLTSDGDCTSARPCSPILYQTHASLPLSLAAPGRSGLDANYSNWHYFVSIHLGSFAPARSEVYPVMEPAQAFVYYELRWRMCTAGQSVAAQPDCLQHLNASATWLPDLTSGEKRTTADGGDAWRAFAFAPVLAYDWIFLGERTKLTPVSSARVTAVVPSADCLVVHLAPGSPADWIFDVVYPNSTLVRGMFYSSEKTTPGRGASGHNSCCNLLFCSSFCEASEKPLSMKAFCGPKCSHCCFVLGIWGIIMLLILGGLFNAHSRALVTDAGGNTFKDMEDAGTQCFIAAGVYVATTLISFWQMRLNKGASSDISAEELEYANY
ncbi:uncharacterized protein MONBRDRAFT_33304 [Monosiga brevicollis MX1]|uniref:Uncharacterized protein n=1 Tax=Monosiga brevicollis TaxID=81824 RepID=A9V4M7_MONBE|nr:uncharacterized protein MONBRDRAFT_33304 [Monosiga brevicollis MX1]EDQ87480.1 predicted protein [Monosiga brevicollis MX1]|eukprot:XP_001747740.1 hypothetical protein [Monosiga brevicollis MX1]